MLGRPDRTLGAVMYLPEEVLAVLLPSGHPAPAEVRFVRLLLPVQHDCPPQWLRDRLLRLADLVDTTFAGVSQAEALAAVCERAGLRLVEPGPKLGAGTHTALPADAGNRISEEELGYWDEEMRWSTRCGASMDGAARLDNPGTSYGLDGL